MAKIGEPGSARAMEDWLLPFAAMFKVKEPNLYEFQVRSQKGRRAKSGFSPPLPVRP